MTWPAHWSHIGPYFQDSPYRTVNYEVSVDFIVTGLCITIKCLQRTCFLCESTEIRVDMSVEAHIAPGFGIYMCSGQPGSIAGD
jgi:hypothetical protein